MDRAERVKLFEVEWDALAKRAWLEEMLPRSLVFYCSKFIPAIMRHRDIITCPLSRRLSMVGGSLPTSPLSPSAPLVGARLCDPATPGPSTALVDLSQTINAIQTPDFVPVKVVHDLRQGKEGVIVEVVEGGKARINWGGEQPSKKLRSLENLVV
jgi:hypothetical protein